MPPSRGYEITLKMIIPQRGRRFPIASSFEHAYARQIQNLKSKIPLCYTRPAHSTQAKGNGVSVRSDVIRIGLDLSCLMARPLTGVGYYTLNLFQAFAARQGPFDVRVVASSFRPKTDLFQTLRTQCSRVRVLPWPTRLKNRMWTTLEWPPLEWFTGQVDIAHGAFHLLPPSRHARRMVTIFDLSNLRYPEMHRAESFGIHEPLLRHAAAKADLIVAISESCKTDVVELLGVAPERVRVVLGGINIEEFTEALDDRLLETLKKRFSIAGDYLIHLGTLEPRKNLPRLLDAYARVRQRFNDCPQLVLAGQAGWMFEDVFSAIERLHLRGRVVHTGYLERNEAVCLLRGAHSCVYPSLYEGFGLPVLEAMAARTPVLTSNVSSMPEVVGGTGILVDPQSVESIESGLVSLLEDRAASLQRAEAAFDRAKRFTWQNSARALAEIYSGLLP